MPGVSWARCLGLRGVDNGAWCVRWVAGAVGSQAGAGGRAASLASVELSKRLIPGGLGMETMATRFLPLGGSGQLAWRWAGRWLVRAAPRCVSG